MPWELEASLALCAKSNLVSSHFFRFWPRGKAHHSPNRATATHAQKCPTIGEEPLLLHVSQRAQNPYLVTNHYSATVLEPIKPS